MNVAPGIELTPLERDLLGHFWLRYKQIGFPSPEKLLVVSRQHTGAGRFTHFEHAGHVQRTDGQLSLGNFSQINMEGLEAGASFWIKIESGKVLFLEVVVNGEQFWDGTERRWSVCDPDSGAFAE